MARYLIHLTSGEVVSTGETPEDSIWYGEHGVFWRIDQVKRTASFFPYANVLKVERNPK